MFNMDFNIKKLTGTPKAKKVKSYACPTCGKKFTFSCNLFRHEKNIHKKMEICKVPGCHFQCSSKRKLSMHAEFAHFAEPNKETLQFPNVEEFYAWKLREEVQNFVCYTKIRGDIKMANSTHRHYVCALSRRVGLKKKTEGKSEVYCPARMLLKESKENGIVRVIYHKVHSHNISFSGSQHLPMPETLRHDIKEKLKAGLNSERIIWELQRKHKAELAVAIRIYNRQQTVTKAHVSMIQRMLVKKGVLKGMIPKEEAEGTEQEMRVTEQETGWEETVDEGEESGSTGKETKRIEEKTGCTRADTDYTGQETGYTGEETGRIGGETERAEEQFVVFDREVQEDMVVANVLPVEADNVLNQQILVPDTNPLRHKMKPPKSKRACKRRSPGHVCAATPLINTTTVDQEDSKIFDMFYEVKHLLSSGKVRKTDLPHIEENLQEIVNIIKCDDSEM